MVVETGEDETERLDGVKGVYASCFIWVERCFWRVWMRGELAGVKSPRPIGDGCRVEYGEGGADMRDLAGQQTQKWSRDRQCQ